MSMYEKSYGNVIKCRFSCTVKKVVIFFLQYFISIRGENGSGLSGLMIGCETILKKKKLCFDLENAQKSYVELRFYFIIILILYFSSDFANLKNFSDLRVKTNKT